MGTQEDGVIETRELRLVDATGKIRCKLFIEEGEPKLVMLDARGTKRLGVGLLSTGEVGLSLYDDRERVHMALIVSGAGSPVVSVIDRSGRELNVIDQPPAPKRTDDDFDLMPHVKNKGLKWLLKK
ncbi:MAG: hypothetical protein AABN33_04230 [Acidobacteriota bacterium]